LEEAGLDGREPSAQSDPFSPEPGVTRVEVPLGRRVMVISDLLLTPEATPTTSAVTTEVARALDTWDGPGILIIAGNLFDLSGSASPLSEAQRSLEAHPALNQALARFLTIDERRVIRQTGTHEPGYDTDPDTLTAIAAKGVEPAGPVDLYLHTATGVRVVRVEPGEHAYAAGGRGSETEFDPAADAKPGVIGPSSAGKGWRSLVARSNRDATWLVGLNRLSDPSALSRFVVSRTLYRRLGRYAWWLLVPFVVAGLLRVAVTPWVMGHLGSGLPARAIRHAHQADLGDQIVIALLVALVVLGVLALVLGLLSRRMWSILGGGAVEEVQAQAAANDAARDAGRRLVGRGYASSRRPPSSRSSPTWAWASTPTSAPPPRWSTSTVGRSGCRPSSCTTRGSAGSSWRPVPSCTYVCCWPATSSGPRAPSSGCSPGAARSGASTRRWWRRTR
jgi:hypothetical protein